MNWGNVLVTVLAIVVIGGVVYVLRPEEKIVLPNSSIPMATPIDNTTPFPPPPEEDREQENLPAVKPIATQVKAKLVTNLGEIDLILDGSVAPLTVGNFVYLAQNDFYDGTIFHRVIPDFMIQGGDPTGTGRGGPGYQFVDEINEKKVVRGALAMANSGPNTNGSQFFIVTGQAFSHLDGLHTVFGEVTAGMDVVDAISAVETAQADKPVEDVVITDVVVSGLVDDPSSAGQGSVNGALKFE